MSTKLRYYQSIAEQSTLRLTENRRNWLSYLDTAGRLYKYPFEEQLMIHTQRPDAVACASIVIWNQKMNRYVRRGAKGIALIDNQQDTPCLKYVFDLDDTRESHRKARRPYIWQLKPEHEAAVRNALIEQYGGLHQDLPRILADDELHNALQTLARCLTESYCTQNAETLVDDLSGSSLQTDGGDVPPSFRRMAAAGTAYCLLSRCGLDTNGVIMEEDWNGMSDFNTQKAITSLGTAVSDGSEQILRDIEVAIKGYERAKQQERNGIHEPTNQSADHRDGRTDKRTMSGFFMGVRIVGSAGQE